MPRSRRHDMQVKMFSQRGDGKAVKRVGWIGKLSWVKPCLPGSREIESPVFGVTEKLIAPHFLHPPLIYVFRPVQWLSNLIGLERPVSKTSRSPFRAEKRLAHLHRFRERNIFGNFKKWTGPRQSSRALGLGSHDRRVGYFMGFGQFGHFWDRISHSAIKIRFSIFNIRFPDFFCFFFWFAWCSLRLHVFCNFLRSYTYLWFWTLIFSVVLKFISLFIVSSASNKPYIVPMTLFRHLN